MRLDRETLEVVFGEGFDYQPERWGYWFPGMVEKPHETPSNCEWWCRDYTVWEDSITLAADWSKGIYRWPKPKPKTGPGLMTRDEMIRRYEAGEDALELSIENHERVILEENWGALYHALTQPLAGMMSVYGSACALCYERGEKMELSCVLSPSGLCDNCVSTTYSSAIEAASTNNRLVFLKAEQALIDLLKSKRPKAKGDGVPDYWPKLPDGWRWATDIRQDGGGVWIHGCYYLNQLAGCNHCLGILWQGREKEHVCLSFTRQCFSLAGSCIDEFRRGSCDVPGTPIAVAVKEEGK